MATIFEAEVVGATVRLDLYGEVREAGRIAAFLTRDEALILSRQLTKAALQLPTQFGIRKDAPPADAEELV